MPSVNTSLHQLIANQLTVETNLQVLEHLLWPSCQAIGVVQPCRAAMTGTAVIDWKMQH